ncbi:MAG: response regulator [Verrucomicrobiales bacterium]
MVVDDEVAICETTALALHQHGYRVFTASDGVEALAMLKQQVVTVDLILTDLVMPFIDGVTRPALNVTHAQSCPTPFGNRAGDFRRNGSSG